MSIPSTSTSPSPLPQRFGRWRLFGQSGIWDALSVYTSNGATQTSKTDRVAFTMPSTFGVIDPKFLYVNGYWTSGVNITPNGNAITIKPFFEYFGNTIPLAMANPTSGTLSTVAQTGISTTVTTGVNSATQTVASTANFTVGQTHHYATANVNVVVKSIASSTSVTYWSAVNSTSSEVVTITAYYGQGYIIPDGVAKWTDSVSGMILSPSTSYQFRTYLQVSAGQTWPNVLPYSVLSTQRSSDFVTGGTPDGADYSNSITLPGYGNSSSYYFCPVAAVGRQLTPAPVAMVVGDSIAFGSGNNGLPFQGIIGYAIQQAGIYQFNTGLGGASTVNLSRFSGIVYNLAQYADTIGVCCGNNDINSGFSLSSVIIPAFLLYAQGLTANGANVYFLVQTPRSTSSDSWATLANQGNWNGSTAFDQVRIQLNNWMRDTSANGMLSYLNANIGTVGRVAGIMDVPLDLEVGPTGTAIVLNQTTYTFTTTSANATYAATYTDANGNVHTVGPTIAAGTTLVCTCPASTNVPTSGVLNKQSGTGDSTITFSSRLQSSANQQAYNTGCRWVVNGTANYYTGDGQHPNQPAYILAQSRIGALANFGSILSGNYANLSHP